MYVGDKTAKLTRKVRFDAHATETKSFVVLRLILTFDGQEFAIKTDYDNSDQRLFRSSGHKSVRSSPLIQIFTVVMQE